VCFLMYEGSVTGLEGMLVQIPDPSRSKGACTQHAEAKPKNKTNDK
jgi:hypothetical protein